MRHADARAIVDGTPPSEVLPDLPDADCRAMTAIIEAYDRRAATAAAVAAITPVYGWDTTVQPGGTNVPDRLVGVIGGVTLTATQDRWTTLTLQFDRDAGDFPLVMSTGLRRRPFDALTAARRLATIRDAIVAATERFDATTARTHLGVGPDADTIDIRAAFTVSVRKAPSREAFAELVGARLVADATT